jgi:ABC-type glycerol-3-phosphate transport system substrate-binding protein
MLDTVRILLVATILGLAACSAPAPDAGQKKAVGVPEAVTTTIANKHPLAKYLELSGYRLSENGAGKVTVKFVVINHSDADIGDLSMKIKLVTTAAKPEDPPITEFAAKVPQLGPQEVKDVSATATTKLRIYEMPDWQFIRAEVVITDPAP